MNVTVARCGNIYGAGDLNWSRIVPGTVRSLHLGQQPVLRSGGGNIRDYIYVRDVVSAYLTLAEQSHRAEIRGQAFNFSPESRFSVLDIVSAVGRVMNIVPEPVIQNTAQREILDQTLDASKAHRLLNWRAEWQLEDGLRETIAWYRSHLSAALQPA
jgi:CDP-glucose 4,6-dehydratase